MTRLFIICLVFVAPAFGGDTLPPLEIGKVPDSFAASWEGFDPRAEPLELEVLKEWEVDGVVLRVLRYRIGTFKGEVARMAAIYGFPKGAKGLPGLVQIHGGGQYAHENAVLTNAKRGYSTISIAWAGRLSAGGYQVNPEVVKLFWENRTDDPRYRVTTDWGAVDGYHAPSRHPQTVFPSAKATPWTVDAVESPRNSPWFLCTLGAGRALCFLEGQPEVDPERLGVYGHSMGGKLTVMTTAADARVKAAAPSCGGISDRGNESELFRATIGDDSALPQISCPIIFLSPANDFHGRINDLPRSVAAIQSADWRVTCSPHHNHQDTAPFEVATQLWFDQHLKGTFVWPATPETTVDLRTDSGSPRITVRPDAGRPIESVDVYYTQQGVDTSDRTIRNNRIHQFWHHAKPSSAGGTWSANLPLEAIDKPLWVYANVHYKLPAAVTGAGYYYGTYSTTVFNVSSLVEMIPPAQLQAANLKATQKPSTVIEDFSGDWAKHWFRYKVDQWAMRTNKLYNPLWRAPAHAKLGIAVKADKPNTVVVRIDDYAAELKLAAGSDWQSFALAPGDFRNAADEPLSSWEGIMQLELAPTLHLRKGDKRRKVGGNWHGAAPVFRNLHWQTAQSGS